MSTIDNIVKKLHEESETRKAELQRDHDEKREKMVHEILGKAEKERDLILSKAEKRAEFASERILENSNVRLRDRKLAEEQILVDRVLALAEERLKNLSDDAFLENIEKALREVDGKALRIRVPKRRLDAVKAWSKDLIVDEEQFTDGGFILMSEKIDYNFQIQDLLQEKREELAPEIIQRVKK